MQMNPFDMLNAYNDHLFVPFFDKADDIHADTQVAKQLKTEHLVSLRQVHGNHVIITREPMRRTEEADGVWTDAKDLTLTIRVADCQAFVAYVPSKNIVGLLHAGWRGLVRGTIPSFFQTLQEEWDVDAADVLIGATPSLCTQCAEFTDPERELTGIDPRFFDGRHADLRAIADQQFVDAGVKRGNIERMPGCTKCDTERFWSYRGGDREKVIAGYGNVLTCAIG